MTRYQALRSEGCGWFAAWVIAIMNNVLGVPKGEIRFMHITMEYEP